MPCSRASSCDQAVDEPRVLGVELAGGLVGQQEPRPVRERGAEGDPLLLAAGERARACVEPVAEPDPLEERRRPTARASRRGEPSSSSPSPTVWTQVRSGESARA